MKAWFVRHKFYLIFGAILVFGCVYYFFVYQPGTSNQQDIPGIESKTRPSNETSQMGEGKNESGQTKQANKDETLIVDVKGEIKQPGVYHSNQNERVIDVIQRAGGLTENADQSQVNFAAHVQDEMVIYIPAKGEAVNQPPAANQVSTGVNKSGGNTGKININKADENELQNLPGIGPAKAAAIIQYRQENGSFSTIEDLKKISGIGDKTYVKLQEMISVQ